MRVAVVGATGNAGTALLRALADAPDVDAVVGIARRRPDVGAPPYDAATWRTLDVGRIARDDAEEDALVGEIVAALEGVDAVVHLAWLVQPNHERDLLRRTNVTGTRRMADAVVRAGVPHLVVASSVGAYAPAGDDVPRTEDWPTRGIRTSHYSVDKVAQERVLDAVEAADPGLVVTRLRPALIFQADAGAEIDRYFLGPLVPAGLLRHGRPPLLPLPHGLRLQAVHADDVAQAYLAALRTRPRGAVNVAADDVLRVADLARLLDHGRAVEVPRGLLRTAVDAAWHLRALPTDPGWLDMAMEVPLMDTTRARTELGWRPRRTAAEAVTDLMAGLAKGRGLPSVPLRPRGTEPDEVRQRRREDAVEDRLGGSPRLPEHLDPELVGLYLSDHLTGATAGLHRAERMAEAYADTEHAEDLGRLADQLAEERELLGRLIDDLDLPRRPHRQALAWAAEHLGRLKLNGRLVSRSPMSRLLEYELMRSAVMGKLGLWQSLGDHADQLGLERGPFDDLARQARDQAAMLDRLHGDVRGTTLVRGAEVR